MCDVVQLCDASRAALERQADRVGDRLDALRDLIDERPLAA
jgi:hypothetical protein